MGNKISSINDDGPPSPLKAITAFASSDATLTPRPHQRTRTSSTSVESSTSIHTHSSSDDSPKAVVPHAATSSASTPVSTTTTTTTTTTTPALHAFAHHTSSSSSSPLHRSPPTQIIFVDDDPLGRVCPPTTSTMEDGKTCPTAMSRRSSSVISFATDAPLPSVSVESCELLFRQLSQTRADVEDVGDDVGDDVEVEDVDNEMLRELVHLQEEQIVSEESAPHSSNRSNQRMDGIRAPHDHVDDDVVKDESEALQWHNLHYTSSSEAGATAFSLPSIFRPRPSRSTPFLPNIPHNSSASFFAPPPSTCDGLVEYGRLRPYDGSRMSAHLHPVVPIIIPNNNNTISSNNNTSSSPRDMTTALDETSASSPILFAPIAARRSSSNLAKLASGNTHAWLTSFRSLTFIEEEIRAGHHHHHGTASSPPDGCSSTLGEEEWRAHQALRSALRHEAENGGLPQFAAQHVFGRRGTRRSSTAMMSPSSPLHVAAALRGTVSSVDGSLSRCHLTSPSTTSDVDVPPSSSTSSGHAALRSRVVFSPRSARAGRGAPSRAMASLVSGRSEGCSSDDDFFGTTQVN